MDIAVLGVDLGKNVCSVVGLDVSGAVIMRRKVRRDPRNDPRTRRGSRAGSGSATRLCKPNGQSALQIRGIGGNFASVLTREVFYRTFDNRRQIASYLGLAPTPFQSGGMDRDRRINRAGNSRACKTLVQLAWLWLRYQPESSQRHGSGTVLARFRVESAASQSSPWRASS